MFKEIKMSMNNGKDEVTVFYMEGNRFNYYCQQGASMVNITLQELNNDDDLDEVHDVDTMSFPYHINSLEEFKEALCI